MLNILEKTIMMMSGSSYGFREPLMIDQNDQLYITCAQMQFFLNRPKGLEKFNKADKEFLDYYKECKLYNFFYDRAVEDNNIQLYWDYKKQSLAFMYPEGEIDSELFDLGLIDEDGTDYLE